METQLHVLAVLGEPCLLRVAYLGTKQGVLMTLDQLDPEVYYR